MRSMAQELPNCFIGAIIDDVTVCSPIQLIPRVIQIVRVNLEAYGIEISLPKCLIYTLPEHSLSIPVEVPPIIPRSDSGFKLLGGPIHQAREEGNSLIPFGDPSFLDSFLQDFLDNVRSFLQKITCVRSTQSAFQLLLLSANNKISHLLRGLPAINGPAFYNFYNLLTKQYCSVSCRLWDLRV